MHKLIDRIDTFCLTHAWVPSWVRVRVGLMWQRTMRHKTWTAVGEDDKQESGPLRTESADSRIRSAEKLGLTGDGE